MRRRSIPPRAFRGRRIRRSSATIDSKKAFFESLKSLEDKTVIDLWQFDDRVRHLIDGVELEKGAGRAIKNYTTGGCTALYDAISIGIDELGMKFAAMREEERPDAVLRVAGSCATFVSGVPG